MLTTNVLAVQPTQAVPFLYYRVFPFFVHFLYIEVRSVYIFN